MPYVEAREANLDLNLGRLYATGVVTETSLTVTNDLGDAELSGTFRGTTDIRASLGNGTMNTTLSEREHTYEMDADLGSIYIDGQKQSDHVDQGSGENKLFIKDNLGDITVNFA